MKTHPTGISVAVGIWLLMSLSASGQPLDMPPDPGFPPGKGSRCLEQLGLTPEQENAMAALREQFVSETSEIRETLRKTQHELDALFRNITAKDEDIIAKQREASGLMDQLAQKATEYRLKARKVLTADQLAKLPPGCHLGVGLGLGLGPGGCGRR